MPERLEIVSREKLEAFAGPKAPKPTARRRNGRAHHQQNVQPYDIDSSGGRFRRMDRTDRDQGRGRNWTFRSRPCGSTTPMARTSISMPAERSRRGAVTIQLPGKMGFVAELFEPGNRRRRNGFGK